MWPRLVLGEREREALEMICVLATVTYDLKCSHKRKARAFISHRTTLHVSSLRLRWIWEEINYIEQEIPVYNNC